MNRKRKISNAQAMKLLKIIDEELGPMSGKILYRVYVEWCELHEIKKCRHVYLVKDISTLIADLQETYNCHGCELRSLNIEWMLPIECVHEIEEVTS